MLLPRQEAISHVDLTESKQNALDLLHSPLYFPCLRLDPMKVLKEQ